MVGNRPTDPDPGIGGKAGAFLAFVFLRGIHKPDIACLNQVFDFDRTTDTTVEIKGNFSHLLHLAGDQIMRRWPLLGILGAQHQVSFPAVSRKKRMPWLSLMGAFKSFCTID